MTQSDVKSSATILYIAAIVDLVGNRRDLVFRRKFKLFLFGHLLPDHRIDSLAINALLRTTFDISKLQDLSLLDDYFRYDIPFEPPDIDEFYDPYREQQELGPR